MCDVLGKSEMIVLSHLQIVKMTLLFIRFKGGKKRGREKKTELLNHKPDEPVPLNSQTNTISRFTDTLGQSEQTHTHTHRVS